MTSSGSFSNNMTKSEKVLDVDEQTIGSNSDEGAVVEDRDIRKKQIFKGGLLFWCALFPRHWRQACQRLTCL